MSNQQKRKRAMKSRNILWAVVLSATIALVGCNNGFEESEMALQTDTIELMAGIDTDSRTFLGDDSGATTPIYWSDDLSDAIGLNVVYYTVEGYYRMMTLKFTKSEETESSSYAKFTTTRDLSSLVIDKVPIPKESDGPHVAKYPYTISSISYGSQKGTKEDLKNYHYMEAYIDNTTELEWTALPALTFETKVAIVKLTLSHEDFKGQTVSGVKIQSDGATVVQATESFMADANGSVEVWFAIPEANFEMKNTTISAIYNGGDYAYSATLGDKTLAAGKLYKVTKTMQRGTEALYNKSAEQAVTGDFAMKDGTFISGSASLTSEQKANVAGVVFWTTKETDLSDSSKILANLADDKVMAADFPNCTHGLIVALNNISSSIAWQGSAKKGAGLNYIYSNMEGVLEDFQETIWFNPQNKADYADVNVVLGNTDNKGKILGYNNTKVLEAYNAYCNANSKSAYVVKPVQSLATWAASNAAPANTTGWYLPSVKELAMMCYGDYDMVNGTIPATTPTLSVVQLSLVVAGSKITKQYYWSSSEGTIGSGNNSERDYGAKFFDLRYTPNEGNAYKSNTYYVRAVCAF